MCPAVVQRVVRCQSLFISFIRFMEKREKRKFLKWAFYVCPVILLFYFLITCPMPIYTLYSIRFLWAMYFGREMALSDYNLHKLITFHFISGSVAGGANPKPTEAEYRLPERKHQIAIMFVTHIYLHTQATSITCSLNYVEK